MAAAKWIEVRRPEAKTVAGLVPEVDRGEAEAIALAMKIPAAVLLMDDLRARRVAAQRHVRIIGTVGLLIRARKAGLVPSLRPLLRSLVTAGIHLNERLIVAALLEVGEN